MDMQETIQILEEIAVEDVVNQEVEVVVLNKNIIQIVIEIMTIEKHSLVVIMVTTTRKMIKIMNQDTEIRTAKTLMDVKVKKAMQAISIDVETKEATLRKIVTMKMIQILKGVLELETECLKNLILNKEKTSHLECL